MAQLPITQLLPAILQLCRECPTPTAVGAYVRAARQFCQGSHWLTHNAGITARPGVSTYTIPAGESEVIGIKAIAAFNAAGQGHPLTEQNPNQWNPLECCHTGEQVRYYAYLPEGKVALHATPQCSLMVPITAIVQPKDDAESIDSTLTTRWRYALEDGALAYLLGLARTPWADPREAQRREILFQQVIHSASHSAGRGHNAGADPTNQVGSPNAGIRTRVLPI